MALVLHELQESMAISDIDDAALVISLNYFLLRIKVGRAGGKVNFVSTSRLRLFHRHSFID